MRQYNGATNSELDMLISEHIHSARDRDIMRMKLIDGLTYERIAEYFGMSPRQIKSIVKRHSETVWRSIMTE